MRKKIVGKGSQNLAIMGLKDQICCIDSKNIYFNFLIKPFLHLKCAGQMVLTESNHIFVILKSQTNCEQLFQISSQNQREVLPLLPLCNSFIIPEIVCHGKNMCLDFHFNFFLCSRLLINFNQDCILVSIMNCPYSFCLIQYLYGL